MPREVLYNQAGAPFSKWKPADKFAYVLENQEPDVFKVVYMEHAFMSGRKWRLDYAWPNSLVAVEIDGFGYGHQAQQNIGQQNEKRNAAVCMGWSVLVFDSRWLGAMERVKQAAEDTANLVNLRMERE